MSLIADKIFNLGNKDLIAWIEARDQVFVLVDENTEGHCLPNLLAALPQLREANLLVVPAQESAKTLGSAETMWRELLTKKASRNSGLINLGGGLVTDLGAFVANNFKRGMPFIQIPSSLLAMVDAAVGGKCGVNLGGYKNMLGQFATPDYLLIIGDFLKTLPPEEIRNGFIEMLKVALLHDKDFWKLLSLENATDEKNIIRAIELKEALVKVDPFDKAERQALNLGHTFGHAFEAYHAGGKSAVSHGEAVAYGIIIEGIVSVRQKILNESALNAIKKKLSGLLSFECIEEGSIPFLMDRMMNDKKNKGEGIVYASLEKIGSFGGIRKVTKAEFESAIKDFNQWLES